MQKRIAAVAVMAALLPLGSCSGSPSSTSSSSSPSSSVPPVVLFKNYRREGVLKMGLTASSALPGVLDLDEGYQSPIALTYQADEKQAYGPQAALSVRPFELSGTSEERLDQAEKNREILQGLFSFVTAGFEEAGQDTDFLPILADRYATPFDSLAAVPDETLSFNFIGDRFSFVGSEEMDGTLLPTFFARGTAPEENPLSGIDLSSVQIDAPALLAYLDTLFPDETALRPIFVLFGDVVDFLTDFLSVSIEEIGSDESRVKLYVNDEGRERILDFLRMQVPSELQLLLNGVSLNEIALTVDLFNDGTLLNQVSSVQFAVTMSGALFNASLYMDASLEKEHTMLDDDYFQGQQEFLEKFQNAYEEAKPILDVVKEDAPFKDGIGGTETPDAGKIDLSKSGAERIEKAATDYFSLSSDAKGLLGDVFSSAKEEGELKEVLLSRHQEGVKLVEALKEAVPAEKVVDDDNFRSLYDPVVAYGNWSQALRDYGADVASEKLQAYLQGRLSRFDDARALTADALKAFVATPDEGKLSAALEKTATADALLDVPASYFADDLQSAYERSSEGYAALFGDVPSAFHSYFSGALPGFEYADLVSCLQGGGYTDGRFFDRTLLSSSEKSAVRSLLSSERKAICQQLLDSASSLLSLEASHLSLKGRIDDLSSAEALFLGTDDERTTVEAFYSTLSETLS